MGPVQISWMYLIFFEDGNEFYPPNDESFLTAKEAWEAAVEHAALSDGAFGSAVEFQIYIAA